MVIQYSMIVSLIIMKMAAKIPKTWCKSITLLCIPYIKNAHWSTVTLYLLSIVVYILNCVVRFTHISLIKNFNVFNFIVLFYFVILRYGFQ